MDKLENFFEDVHRIREILESTVKGQEIAEDSCEKRLANESVTNNISQPTPVAPVMPVAQPTTPAATVIPTTAQVESFTQDQIAVAMSNAIAVNRKDIVDKILTTFNAQCLMQIDPANYNQIAAILREAGIQL